jgi:group II intron reverse transcriptase/maturase
MSEPLSPTADVHSPSDIAPAAAVAPRAPRPVAAERPDADPPRRAAAEVPARVIAAQFNLAGAWQRVLEKGGMPGVDGVSVRRFARCQEGWLRALQARLAGDRYRPLPLRLAELEKKSGGRRLLLVPAVADRIVQAAAAEWLGNRWNADFDPASFAYRPGLGVHDALRAIADLRDRGFRWVLDADVRSFFDSIDHARLFAIVDQRLGSRCPLAGWIRQWVQASVWDGEEIRFLPRGVPQGSPLSPLLANLFLDSFDRRLRQAGIPLVRYADDFIVLGRTPFALAESRVIVEETLAGLELSLNEEKTRVSSIDRSFRFLGAEIRADAILLPFDKKKAPKKPTYVAPIMPPALLRAHRAGHLVATRPLEWKSRPAERDPGGAAARNPRRPVLGRLAGDAVATVLISLKGGRR